MIVPTDDMAEAPACPGVRLRTARLGLRSPAERDVADLVRLADNRAVAAMLSRMPHPYGVADGRAFIETVAPKVRGCVHAITLAGEDRFIGCAGVEENAAGAMEVGYWLGEPYWGKGYATEAAQALVDHAFTALGVDGLHASCRVANAASRRVLHKCGFQYVGQGMADTLLSGRMAVERYRLDRGVWAGLKGWSR